jgi:hypothetical protein
LIGSTSLMKLDAATPRMPRTIASQLGIAEVTDVAPDGRALLIDSQKSLSVRARLSDAAEEKDLSWSDDTTPIALSADGKLLLLADGNDENHVILRPTDGTEATDLGPGLAVDLSPDGKWALAMSKDRRMLDLVPIGPEQRRTIPSGPIEAYTFARYFPDGKRILVDGMSQGNPGVWILNVDGSAPAAVPAKICLAISPDGKRVLCIVDEPLVTMDLDGGHPKPLPEGTHGVQPNWTTKGIAVTTNDPTKTRLELDRLDPETGKRTQERTLSVPAGDQLYTLVENPPGDGYAYSVAHISSNLYLVTGLN